MPQDTPKLKRAKAPAAPRADLATLLAAVFAHPDLPYLMSDHMADALCEMDSDFDKYENPEVMREILRGQQTVSARRKGGAR